MKTIEATYDDKACAVYVKLSTDLVDSTEEVQATVNIDRDEEGNIVGVEVILP